MAKFLTNASIEGSAPNLTFKDVDNLIDTNEYRGGIIWKDSANTTVASFDWDSTATTGLRLDFKGSLGGLAIGRNIGNGDGISSTTLFNVVLPADASTQALLGGFRSIRETDSAIRVGASGIDKYLTISGDNLVGSANYLRLHARNYLSNAGFKLYGGSRSTPITGGDYHSYIQGTNTNSIDGQDAGDVRIIGGRGGSVGFSANAGNVLIDGGQLYAGSGSNGNVLIGSLYGNSYINGATEVKLQTGGIDAITVGASQAISLLGATTSQQPITLVNSTRLIWGGSYQLHLGNADTTESAKIFTNTTDNRSLWITLRDNSVDRVGIQLHQTNNTPATEGVRVFTGGGTVALEVDATQNVSIPAGTLSVGGVISQFVNWNTAYGWGDHSTQSYLKGNAANTITNPTFTSTSGGVFRITAQSIQNISTQRTFRLYHDLTSGTPSTGHGVGLTFEADSDTTQVQQQGFIQTRWVSAVHASRTSDMVLSVMDNGTAVNTLILAPAGSTLLTSLTANSFIKSGGTASQFLKADGTIDSSTYITSANLTYTASTRLLEIDTGTDVTLPLFTSTDAGLVPLSGGGTTNFLRADGTWAAPAGGGDVTKVGTPVDNQIGVWTGDGTIEGTTGFLYDGTRLEINNGNAVNMRLWNAAGTFYHDINNTATANRTVTLPNATGTIALTNAATLTSLVTIDGLTTTHTLSISGGALASGTKTMNIGAGAMAAGTISQMNLMHQALGSTNLVIGNSGAAGGTYTNYIPTINWASVPADDAGFSTSNLLVRDSTGNMDKLPASGGGTTNFLRADGTWAAPSGSSSLSGLSDTIITTPTSGSLLMHNGTEWIESTKIKTSNWYLGQPSGLDLEFNTLYPPYVNLKHPNQSATNIIGGINGVWGTDSVAAIWFKTGEDTVNKDDGSIEFLTSSSGSLITALTIQSDRVVKINNGTLALADRASVGTPPTNIGYIYVDSADSLLKFKNDAGTLYTLTSSSDNITKDVGTAPGSLTAYDMQGYYLKASTTPSGDYLQGKINYYLDMPGPTEDSNIGYFKYYHGDSSVYQAIFEWFLQIGSSTPASAMKLFGGGSSDAKLALHNGSTYKNVATEEYADGKTYIANNTSSSPSQTITNNNLHNQVYYLSSTSTVTVTLGGAGHTVSAGYQMTIIKTGASGSINFTAGTGQTVNKATGSLTGQYKAVTIYYAGSNVWNVMGALE